MVIAKPKKKKAAAKVSIDASTAVKLEAKLRDGLVGSPAHISDGPPFKKGKKTTTVQLDAATVARFANHLKTKLIASEAHIFDEGKKKKKK